jgi:hypothetical protein
MGAIIFPGGASMDKCPTASNLTPWGTINQNFLKKLRASVASHSQHRKRVRQQTGRFLIACDTTHVDFGGPGISYSSEEAQEKTK